MNSPALSLIPLDVMSRETGIAKETLRKWELRYGYPIPVRLGSSHREYEPETVNRLRLIKRLVDSGVRPGKVVGRSESELQAILRQAPPDDLPESLQMISERALELIRDGDAPGIAMELQSVLMAQGLGKFALSTVPDLMKHFGKLWAQGRLTVYEEHLFSQVTRTVLQHAVYQQRVPASATRVLLATAPEELHSMGLVLVDSLLTLAGARCVNFGAQVPAFDIAQGARQYQADVVGISFSVAYPSRQIGLFIMELRQKLDPRCALWVGGGGVDRMRTQWPGVQRFGRLESAVQALAQLNPRAQS